MAGGIGANVVDGNLNTAIQVWKQELKTSEKLTKLYEKREYVKPSRYRRKQLDMAIYRKNLNLE